MHRSICLIVLLLHSGRISQLSLSSQIQKIRDQHRFALDENPDDRLV
jgi:hypothetical protein